MKPKIALPPDHVPAHLIGHFDFRRDPAMEIDPWARLSALRDAPEIFYSIAQGGYWVITCKAIVEEILLKPQVFSSAYNSIPRIDDDMRLIPPNLDPPEHEKYRTIVNHKVFHPAAIREIEPQARSIMQNLIGAAKARGQGDVIADFARPFPISTFVKLMGMPESRLPEFSVIEQFFRGEDAEKVGDARMTLFKYIQDWVMGDAEGDDARVLRDLKSSEIDGKRLSAEKLTIIGAHAILCWTGYCDRTDVLYGAFSRNASGASRSLSCGAHLIPSAVEELMRRFGIANLCRLVVEDTELRGVTMKKGDLVMVSSAMAGVDETSYADAMVVDFERPNIRSHCGFGKGIHGCPGQRLARIQLCIFLEEILSNLPNLRLSPSAEVRFLPGTIMAMRQLPVLWDI